MDGFNKPLSSLDGQNRGVRPEAAANRDKRESPTKKTSDKAPDPPTAIPLGIPKMIAPLAALLRYHDLQTEAGHAEISENQEVVRLKQAMSDGLYRKYLRTHRRHGLSAVVPSERGVCSGCHMRQPAGAPEIEEDISECQNCGRLLYDPDVAFDYSVG
jgi:hypothetical protein